MRDWNNLGYLERISRWKDFREGISFLDNDNDIINAVHDFWSRVPIHSGSHMDIYAQDTWDKPWDIIHGNKICYSKLAILIHETFMLSDIELSSQLVIMHNGKKDNLAVSVNGKFLIHGCIYDECSLGKHSIVHYL